MVRSQAFRRTPVRILKPPKMAVFEKRAIWVSPKLNKIFILFNYIYRSKTSSLFSLKNLLNLAQHGAPDKTPCFRPS